MTPEILNGMRFLKSNTGIPKNPDLCFACKTTPKLELASDYTWHADESSNSTFRSWDPYAFGLKVEQELFGIVMTMQNAADTVKPAYRQFKGVLPFTAIEMGASSAIQTMQDFDNDLTLPQRFGRSTIVGLEAGATDLASDGFGAAGFVQAGPAGYFVASMAANFTADRSFDSLNARMFPRLGLGAYP